MRPAFFIALLLGLFGCSPKQPITTAAAPSQEPLLYIINLNDRADDYFRVELQVSGLGSGNGIYQFAATAPGTYQTMNIGRFVRNFQAFDAAGKSLEVKQLNVNQWQISQPEQAAKITYEIGETWDTPVADYPVYLMAGTSLEKDHVQICPHAVFGYPTGMQGRPLKIRLQYPKEWLVGTALDKDRNGDYLADSFDHAVDSPILLGNLTYASTKLHDGQIEVYTYSMSGKVTSQKILEETQDVLESVGLFLKGFPAKRYTFLFLLEQPAAGAWEHSYSSNYVLPDKDFDFKTLDEVASHEIFHVFTPLNLHSEVIESFNFVQPVPSDHLWLYEATTEWAAHIMRLRSKASTLDTYLAAQKQKMMIGTQMMDPSISLTELAHISFTKEGAGQFANIYMRGAVIISLLDIRLLELSGGKRGLREVLLELAAKYGKDKPFSEKTFFDDFAAATYPEIRTFFTKYVEGKEPLPIAETYAKLGIRYEALVPGKGAQPTLGFDVAPLDPEKIGIKKVTPELAKQGLVDGDLILMWGGLKANVGNFEALGKFIATLKAGDVHTMVVKRDGKELELKLTMQEERDDKFHVFTPDPQATPEQLKFREIWMTNL